MRIFKQATQEQNGCATKVKIGSRLWAGAIVAGLIGFGCVTFRSVAQDPSDVNGADVQTRGPVHEAFAGIVSFNPEAGMVVSKPPPEPIEEMPPDQRPEGQNVTWIPGYWAWDDERNDYLWVSGTWRDLPPGRAWVAGYWANTGQGYRWTSGYWVDAAQQESTYLPTPPATMEVGPNIAAPSPDYIWMPGCWVWTNTRYAWRPGYWALGRPDWDWVPAHYVWSPRGCVFVDGYWDYPVERRGCLFAPVFFGPHVYARPHFVYSPSIVIDLGVFTDHLFCRPRYSHYYFGDYYAPAYVHSGFYASFSFHIGHHGYDPIYSHHRWEHRNDRDWGHRMEVAYHNRRDHEDARPPRTWAQQNNIIQQNNITINKTRVQNRTVVANTFEQYRNRSDNQVRFQSVARDERQRLAQRGREVQSSRQQRQTLEVRAQETAGQRGGEARGGAREFKAQVPKSSIVSRPVRELEPRHAPPEVQRAPQPDSNVQPRREQQRQQSRRERNEARAERSTPAPAPNVSAPERSAPSVSQPERRAQPERQVQPERRVQPVPQPRQDQRPAQVEPRVQAPQQERRAQPAQPDQRRIPARPPERRVEPQSGRMAQSPSVVTEESQRNARQVEGRRQQAQPRANPNSNPGHNRKGAENLKHDNRGRDRE